MGMATMIWETISGGVMIAATKKMTTTITFLAFFIHPTFTSPSWVSSTDRTGSSNTTPKMTKMVSRKEI